MNGASGNTAPLSYPKRGVTETEYQIAIQHTHDAYCKVVTHHTDANA